MVREFKLPDVGEGVAEGEIVSWLVEPGETVTEDQPVAEVETDKAVVEVPSPVDGTVRELRAEEGAVVPVGEVLITFDVEGEKPPGTDDAEPTAGETVSEESGAPPAEPTEEASASNAEASTRGGGRVFAAPSARRLARELGVDIAAVNGSGPGGRVTESDVQASAEGTEHEGTGGRRDAESAEETVEPTVPQVDSESEAEWTSAPADATDAASVGIAERDRTLATPATRRVARELDVDLNAVPAVEERDGEAFVTSEAVSEYARAQRHAREADVRALAAAEPTEREERVPYRGIRRTIGRAMERSKYTAPHVTHHDTADASALVEAREKLRPVAEERGISLTYMPLVMKACVAALREFPYLNSSLDEAAEEIVLKEYYNVGVAVGTDAGLLVPVVENVDRKGLLQLATEMNELIGKAHDRSIAREEMQGGTFTITNFGAIGGEYATPIINHPETAVLGLGAIEERPVAVDGEVLARPTLPLSLSIDHRVIDGAIAARFANALKRYLEEPTLLLLE